MVFSEKDNILVNYNKVLQKGYSICKVRSQRRDRVLVTECSLASVWMSGIPSLNLMENKERGGQAMGFAEDHLYANLLDL